MLIKPDTGGILTTFAPTTISLDDILLDPNNYRFEGDRERRKVAQKRYPEESVQAAALARLKADGLSELKQSISSNGFVPVERIVVRPYLEAQDETEGTELPKQFVVLEGNRRTATLKILQAEHLAGIEMPESVVETFGDVPVTVVEEGDASTYLSIMGIRHVGGVKEWGGHQSAQLVFELRNDHGLSAQEVGSRLGLSAQEINRRYRAFQAMEQMREDEEYGDDVSNELYPLFHEALVSPKVRVWLGWSEEHYRFENDDRRESFYSLISPFTDTKGVKRPPKITSYSEVRELKTLLDNDDAVESLLDLDKPFSDASALVKSADVSRNWMTKVSAAMNALDHMGIRESKKLEPPQIEKLEELRDLIDDLLTATEAENEQGD